MKDALEFGEVLEAADQLSQEDQETLLEILRRRLAERRRDEIVADVLEARREHREEETKETTPGELMSEILE